MDIAKYISLFLLKYNYCNIPGLGQLKIVKQGATTNGSEINAGSYTVELNNVGAIDDSFPSFIAVAEQVSISKASNAISTFVVSAKELFKENKEVIIPNVGKFYSSQGTTKFHTDANLTYTPPSIPTPKVREQVVQEKYPTAQEKVPQQAPEPYEPSSSSGTINWGKIALMALILAGIITGIYFGIQYINNSGKPRVPSNTVETKIEEPQIVAPQVTDSINNDTLQTQPTNQFVVDNNTTQQNGAGGNYKVVINTYTSLDAADKRVKKLSSYGNPVTLVTKDSSNHLVVLDVVYQGDEQKLLDSLKNHFNPKQGVSFLK